VTSSRQLLELRIAELDSEQVGLWRQLAERAAEPNPFAEPDFLIPACEHLAGGPDRLLVVADPDGWRACVSLAPTRVRALTRADEVGVRQFGFLSTPLTSEREPQAAAALLVEALAERADPLLLERLAASGPFYEALEGASRRGAVRVAERQDFERALLTRDGDRWDEHLGKHHLREFRRLGRRLAEQLGDELVCEDRAGDPAALERFLELERSGWKGRGGTAFASDPSHAEFFRRTCERFHAGGRLQLLELGAGGRTAAMKCNLLAGEGSFAFKIAYDEGLSRWSPGIQLEIRNIELFQASAQRWMDSCATPDNAMINRLWPQRRPLCTVLLAGSGLRGRAAGASLRLTRGLRAVKRAAAGATDRRGGGQGAASTSE
jgi:CelD/BcsL family acetyltransferase involved in cellulose biosynthesis